ncbi:DWNN-domain-containing protein [Lactarius akahatsu]|uniref:DWNN-domain-containing protein n=1 Tax=Lactarius akahatsu TaxID=416441 RepID=A0AAD4LBW8_9AGAM|nr:DWNN-domain-containing protein [Lactarius akahatsu]
MASSVFYKFKSQKTESRVTFDGTGISVFDLKKEIILANSLGKANDFDLVVFDGSSGEEFNDDSQIIPRSSSVVVKRVPPTRPGKGKAAMYVAGPGATATPESRPTSTSGNTWSGKGSTSRRFDKEAPSKLAATAPLQGLSGGKDDEAAAMAAMFQAQSANWEETQEKMSHQTRVYTNPRGTSFGRGGKPFTPHHQQAEKPLPPSYVCYRCGQKGHWIQECPTNNDREFDNKPRIKRTTGIPRSFLKAVDNPGGARIGQGVMVTPEGGYVVAQPDSASWQRQTNKSKSLSEAEVRERPSKDPTIICSIDNRIFRDAVKTPCCGTAYCEDCIQTHLLEKDFICPSCASKVASLDKLAIDKPTRMKVADYIAREIEASQKEEDGPTSESTPIGSVSQTPVPDDLQSGLYAQEDIPADLAMSQMITEMQRQQLQMQLAQAQTIAAALAAAQSASAIGPAELMMPMGMMPMMNQGFNVPQMQIPQQQPQQQPGNADSAYQRQPVNNRRRNIKRERPSDFLEVAGPDAEKDNKVARYWE